ncbi:carbonic anhydrase 15-like isoform X3 [Hemicordylus capensis]|uniref:carbonic anhydrase 15-like isoform X3 n=1 Tax=Hemicordylus capensis TaxID=884348 RepID=UPI00230386A0|nr:carbonic anhydrase 15-like isoform X3 [Hemicordylus capensis]
MLAAWSSLFRSTSFSPIARTFPAAMMKPSLGQTFLTLSFFVQASTASGIWCYESQDPKCGPLHWKNVTQNCGGMYQSPINIDRRKAQRDKNLDEISFEGYDQAPPGRWRLLNDGHTVVMNLDGASAAEQINITKGGLRDIYRALQFHFHWGDLNRNGSEHAIDGHRYPMELHLVHVNTKYKTINEAKGHPNGFAVLSFLFKVSEADNTNYNTIVAGLRNISRAGSFTTPGCEEVVTWTVFEEQIPISKSQLSAFVNTIYFKTAGTTPLKMTSNFRPLQPLNSRKVYASRDATISCSPLLAADFFFALLLALLASQFSCPS